MRSALLAFGLAACVEVDLPIHLDLFHDRPGTIARIEVWVDAGHVDIVAGDDASIERRMRWEGDVRPESQVQRTGGTLVVDGHCPPRAQSCAVDVSIVVDQDVVVEVFTGAGDVTVQGLASSVFVDTAAGVVDLERLSGPVTAYTADGAVRARGLASPAVRVDAVGPVDLAFDFPAVAVDVLATDDVTLAVPAGAYHLELSADAGEVEVEDVQPDEDSPYRLTARAVAGDVTVRGE